MRKHRKSCSCAEKTAQIQKNVRMRRQKCTNTQRGEICASEQKLAHPHTSGKALWMGQNHKCCAPGNNLVMPEREVMVCSSDESQQARNSCQELRIFLLASHGLIPSCGCTGRIWVLAGFIAAAQSACQDCEFEFWLGTGLDQQEWGGA